MRTDLEDGDGHVAPCYVALGDSMSIDMYPNDDAAVRWGVHGRRLGAAALFHRNDATVWPEFTGRDLATLRPGLRFLDLTSDGATIDTVVVRQLPTLDQRAARVATLVTLTVGGNDLLLALSAARDLPALARAAGEVQAAFTALVATLRVRLPAATLVLTTIYDPTDGTGIMPGADGRLPIEILEQANDHIRGVAAATPRTYLADVHRHFLGHGVSAPPLDRWYWPRSIIEPSARGASEIRRTWLDALGAGIGGR